MIDYFFFLVYKLFKFVVFVLPKGIMEKLLNGLAFLAYKLNKKHRKIANANLDLIFGNKVPQEEKDNIVKKSYKNLLYNLYEFVDNQSIDLEGFEKKIIIENEEFILDALKSDRKIILITAHYGNWELGGSFAGLKYKPTTTVGRLLNNQYLNDELQKNRNGSHIQMLPTNEAGKGLIKALKNDRILGLVIDQHNSAGIDVQFLGHKVKQTDSTSRLADKFDAVIIPLFFTMESFGKYTAKFYEPIDPKEFTEENKIEQLTQKQADVMSEQILKHPEQWFLQHKRFKYYHKEIYE